MSPAENDPNVKKGYTRKSPPPLAGDALHKNSGRTGPSLAKQLATNVAGTQANPKNQLPENASLRDEAAAMVAYQQESLLLDDDYTTEVRMQVVHYGEKLLNRVKYEVEILERELVALSSVFNEFLDEVKNTDGKIGALSTSINQGKMQAAKELDQNIKQEVQTVVNQLRLLPKADLDGVEVLYQNLDALQDNYQVIQHQIDTLSEIGIKTEHLEKNLPALEKGLNQFGKAIEERQMNLLVGEEKQEAVIDFDELRRELNAMIIGQQRAMISHLRQTQMMANPKEVEMLRRNQVSFETSCAKMKAQLDLLAENGQDIGQLREDLKPIESGLRQFDRALASNQFLKFTERIYEEIEVVQEQIEEAQNCTNADDLEILQDNVDALYENCDAFADELDTLADHGLDIAAVIEHYDVLRVNIEQFELAVQESSNRIGITSGSLRS